MPSLTRIEAAQRAELLRVLSYQIDLDVSGGSDGFASLTTVRFSCREPGARTFVELRPVVLHEVTLNGVNIDPDSLSGNRLALTGLDADNELVVRATMAYSNTGEGLHRFTDPEDGATYLYAQTFLDEAQRVFACFDQPDLKAPVTMTVTAPEGWEVAANGAGAQVAPGRWEFATTPPLATYFVAVLAGPYHVCRDTHDGIPLALYSRRAFAPHLDKDASEIFEITKACLDRYHELFASRYPFGKYDQAFVPEFNAGAMENPGLVTFRDEYVFRSAVADDDRLQRGIVIAHEMAHMWFGDLVTMRWWDDLWLNESFAEYMGHRILVEATRFTNAWTGFAVARKAWGYASDQRPSTHPVAPESVEDAGLALLNFDGVSYSKGAAVLRQLAAWMGDDAFVAGLREHFAIHAFGNATLEDLLRSLSTAGRRDLASWATVWLRRSQVNTLRPQTSLGPDGRYAAVEIVQTAPPAYPTLRPHRIGVGVYSGGTLVRRVEIDLDPAVDNGRTPVPELVGAEPGELLLVNDGDLTYTKVRFDRASRANLMTVLPALTDSLARALVWAAVADEVRDAEASAEEFVSLCAAGLPTEHELAVFRDVMAFAIGSAVERFLRPEAQPAARATLAATCRTVLEQCAPGDARQLTAARGYISSAGLQDIERLRGWLEGSAPEGLAIDAEMRWAVLGRLCALGAVSEAEIDAEYDRDRTASGAEHAARCRASRPDPAAKAQAWRILIEDTELSNRLVVAAAEGFWHAEQTELTAGYVPRYFAEMPAMASRRTPQVVFQASYFGYPRYAVDPATVAAAEAMLARPDINPILHRVVVDLTDDLRRALAARTLERS